MAYLDAQSPGIRELLERFGAELRRCRHHAGPSQAALADRSVVPQSTISRLERGRAAHAPIEKVILMSASMDRALPLAFCPHRHACDWDRLDVLGRPADPVGPPEEDWWVRARKGGED